jgi:hypothetical protein
MNLHDNGGCKPSEESKGQGWDPTLGHYVCDADCNCFGCNPENPLDRSLLLFELGVEFLRAWGRFVLAAERLGVKAVPNEDHRPVQRIPTMHNHRAKQPGGPFRPRCAWSPNA